MATPTLANSPHSHDPQPDPVFNGEIIGKLTDLVENVSRPKPLQPDLSTTIITPTDDERRERNAAMLLELWALGERMAAQAFEIPPPKPDPLVVALNGFPDVSTRDAFYAGQGEF